MGVLFDHIEVHVSDIERYREFLKIIFEGGSSEIISKTGTSMFTSSEGLRIEIKAKKNDDTPRQSGFCNPCLKRPLAKIFIESLGLIIEWVRETPNGLVYFFKDHENILWHMKDIPPESL